MISKMLAVIALVSAIAANAPADRYFGRLKMSTLRIRYETMQLRKRYESHQLYPGDAMHLLDLTADAYRSWAAAYPSDSWLPSTGFLLAQFYAELPGGVARSRAIALLTYVKSRFPATPYAVKSRALLHRGLPVRLTPAWATASAPPSVPAPAASATAAAPAMTPSPVKTP